MCTIVALVIMSGGHPLSGLQVAVTAMLLRWKIGQREAIVPRMRHL
jgi:hypothetical protein